MQTNHMSALTRGRQTPHKRPRYPKIAHHQIIRIFRDHDLHRPLSCKTLHAAPLSKTNSCLHKNNTFPLVDPEREFSKLIGSVHHKNRLLSCENLTTTKPSSKGTHPDSEEAITLPIYARMCERAFTHGPQSCSHEERHAFSKIRKLHGNARLLAVSRLTHQCITPGRSQTDT